MHKIEVDPQQVMILTEQALSAGWIKGSLRGYGVIDDDGNRDPSLSGVCIVGALQQSLTDVLRSQIEMIYQAIPEFVAAPKELQRQLVMGSVGKYTHGLLTIFRERVNKVLPEGATSIEGWNDTTSTRKRDVLEAMRAALEIITQECIEDWDREARAETGTADAIVEPARVLA
jgi:hypothetical protein